MARTKTIVGAHVGRESPLDEAAALGADCVQIFLSDPQGWRKPPPREDAGELRASCLPLYVHAPYLINVCSPKNNVRYGARKILQQTCDAAARRRRGGGHRPRRSRRGRDRRGGRALGAHARAARVGRARSTSRTPRAATTRWRVASTRWRSCGRRSAPSRTGVELGFCFDTCHAHAAGEDLSDAVERVRTIVGRIDLLHANDSRDAGRHRRRPPRQPRPGRDGRRRAAGDDPRRGPAVLVETPGGAEEMRADLDFVRDALASQA